jgi:starch synthase (maltosyl-transferring)
MIAFVKATPDRSNAVIVVVNLNPFTAHAATVAVPHDAIGVGAGEGYDVEDALTGARYPWGERNFVYLDPLGAEPAHLLRVVRRSTGERAGA